MNPLLEQFLTESRECIQGIGEKLMQLESAPNDSTLMVSLFRLVHTLKGNSGLFNFPEMTRVLHAGEDLMDQVRRGEVQYTQELADQLLDAMDFVAMLCDEIEETGSVGSQYTADSIRLADSLRKFLSNVEQPVLESDPEAKVSQSTPNQNPGSGIQHIPLLEKIPESVRMEAYRIAKDGNDLYWIQYTPVEDCFYQGEDPFHQSRNTPGILWGCITARKKWPKLAELDPYSCAVDCQILTCATRAELDEYYRYVADQTKWIPVLPSMLILPQGDMNGGPVYEDFVIDAFRFLEAKDTNGLQRAVRTLLEISGPDLWLSSALRWLLLVMEVECNDIPVLEVILQSIRTQTTPQWDEYYNKTAINAIADEEASPSSLSNTILTPEESETLTNLVEIQRNILSVPIKENWQLGCIKAVGATLGGFLRAMGAIDALVGLENAVATALDEASAAPLLAWIDHREWGSGSKAHSDASQESAPLQDESVNVVIDSERSSNIPGLDSRSGSDAGSGSDGKFGRRAEDAMASPKSLRVDQVKIDRLMNLIGEMVVSKNALPYLASRAELVFGVRDLSREIKAQYAVINRIAEEMQDAIMQVRMMPVSFVFQRFPRLVRDISRKLNKEVNLVIEGESTEADKNIIESLGDPLIHIIRNSLDHGFETPEERREAGKPPSGTLIIRANHDADRVVIEIHDDGKGIDPQVIKRKAYAKGIIDENTLERITDQEAVNLVFASGFSTAETVSDLSGRGVGMDVVKSAVERVNGAVALESIKGKGTRIRISLPLSMAVTNVMIIESDGQKFGVPVDSVVETVRVPRAEIYNIKNSLATVLRGQIIPLKFLNQLLGLSAPAKTNADEAYGVLVIRVHEESVGLLVDNFHETVDIILKPLTGVLAGLSQYAGSAMMGDGSVLMVLNVKEIF